MLRYLVVANQTLGGAHLERRVDFLVTQHTCRFHVIVPAAPPDDHLDWSEAEALAAAEERLDKALARFREMGAEADGEIGDADPIRAIHDVLRREPYDEIILSTLPEGRSRWLRHGLAHKIERAFGLPIAHIEADANDG